MGHVEKFRGRLTARYTKYLILKGDDSAGYETSLGGTVSQGSGIEKFHRAYNYMIIQVSIMIMHDKMCTLSMCAVICMEGNRLWRNE